MATEPHTATISTVTAIYGLSRSEIYRRLAAGDLRAVKNGKTVLIVAESVREYLASLPPATYEPQRPATPNKPPHKETAGPTGGNRRRW